MTKQEQMERIEKCGVVGIIRTDSSEELIKVADAIKAGGVDIIEVTMTTPGALDVIKEAAEKYGEEVVIGAGSVLDAETARAAMLSGAEFIVSPITDVKMIEICNRYSKVVMPGAFTPTEALYAWQQGADYVKIFPSGSVGPGHIKAIKAPLPQILLVPTGGVNVENAGDFIKAGAATLGVGSALADKKAIANKNFEVLTENAKAFIEAVKKAREEM